MTTSPEYIFRVLCKDARGIVARFTQNVLQYGGNILDLEQHVEEDSGLFAMRMHFEKCSHLNDLKKEIISNPYEDFRYWMDDAKRNQRVAILVTKEETCLYDLLIQQKMGEIQCEIPLIISNRKDLEPVAKQFNVAFHHLPQGKEEKDRRDQEKKIENLLSKYQIDLVILARYMRILSGDFVNPRVGSIINIHHSFLPAFKGAQPYRQAFERGVKIIGATAHYVSQDLDEGPIIHQATREVSHHYSVKELARAGRELERHVLTQAVRAHLEYRVLLIGKRTIIFHI